MRGAKAKLPLCVLKVFKIKQYWIWLSLKSQTPSLISNQSGIKRLDNIIMTNHIMTLGKLHVSQTKHAHYVLIIEQNIYFSLGRIQST